MVQERKPAPSDTTQQHDATQLGQQARRAWDAWVASKLHHESTAVAGVNLKRGEVAYCTIEEAGLVEPDQAGATTVTDTGVFVVTNDRCVLVGSRRTTEWVYANLLGYSADREALTMFNVRSGQKKTGVKYTVETAPRVDATIAAAIARFHGEDEHAAVVAELEQAYRRAYAEWEELGSHSPPTA